MIAGVSLPDGKLHVIALDVGEGSATLIQTPSGRHILIDAGGDGRTLSAAIGGRLPFWKRKIDVVIITQPTQASNAGLRTLAERYEIPLLVTSNIEAGPLATSGQDELKAKGTKQEIAAPGMIIQVGDGAIVTMLNSPASLSNNDSSEPISLLVSYGELRIVLPGDISSSGAKAVLQASGSPLWVIPSGESALLTDGTFLSQMAPQVVIIRDNANQAIDTTTLAKVIEGGHIAYPLSKHGSVELITDGARVWIMVDR